MAPGRLFHDDSITIDVSMLRNKGDNYILQANDPHDPATRGEFHATGILDLQYQETDHPG